MICPQEVHFKKKLNGSEYRISKMIGAGKIVTDTNEVFRVGEALHEDEFDQLVAWLVGDNRLTHRILEPTTRIEVSIK